MASDRAIKAVIWEDSTPTFLARLKVSSSGSLTNLTQSLTSSITYSVYQRGTSIGTGTLTVSSVVFDTLQTGSLWTVDSTGYNFRTELANTLFPTGNKEYRVEFKFTLSGGAVQHLVFDVHANALRGS